MKMESLYVPGKREHFKQAQCEGLLCDFPSRGEIIFESESIFRPSLLLLLVVAVVARGCAYWKVSEVAGGF